MLESQRTNMFDCCHDPRSCPNCMVRLMEGSVAYEKQAFRTVYSGIVQHSRMIAA